MLEAHNTRLRLTVPVAARCEFENIYHYTVHKTGSQWIKALFSDSVVYRYSGLLPYVPRLSTGRQRSVPPPGHIALSAFLPYERYRAIPKPDKHRAFFVLRDPRDIVVSSYFSLRKSHAPMGDIPTVRKTLQGIPMKDGLLHVIKYLSEKGLYRTLRSWALAPSSDTFHLFRYEDLTGERQQDEMDRLLRHCGIFIPPPELEALVSRYSFSKMRKEQGGTQSNSHYRKGKAGDWRNHFDDEVSEAFVAATGDLVEILGYPATR
ncbi:sulfotransferase domain-containing protein [Micromonospora sp. WMMA1363]|uniref:sulfotransferase domain-containing protein n=1 Tax=Micromonospora sp. WMMA1363 TaxID=3053985 RepID=UPI00259CA610|nr:sulfotransferase domain-containing protein [Micromonospora sp. WMMA1363]MDM4721819.1 sulfotransferase domain-containing protein [Micromonospora sp. WMMA1363]